MPVVRLACPHHFEDAQLVAQSDGPVPELLFHLVRSRPSTAMPTWRRSVSMLWSPQEAIQGDCGVGTVYNWLTEGFDTIDLKEAKALLEELAQ